MTTVNTAVSESGQVTLDGLLLTYVGAPLGSRDSSSYMITKTYDSTLRLTAQADSSIKLKASVNTMFQDFSTGREITFTQSNSTQVTNAITLRRSTSQQITTPAPGTTDNTVFLGLLRPQIQLDGVDGNPSKLLFRFLKATDNFAITASDFQINPAVRNLFRPDTINSFLSKYVPLTDPAGTSLIKPRFKPRLSITLSPGVRDVFTFTTSKGSAFSESKTSATSIEIVEKSNFNFNNNAIKLAFDVGQRIEIKHTSVQETSSNKIISVSTTLNRSSFGVNKVFFDRVFKTFVIIDAGTTGQPIVQGRITDAQGAAIAGALVKLTHDNADHAALTDADGNYTISTAQGEVLPDGTYQVTCGNVSQSVSINRGMAKANFNSVNRASAQERSFEVGELIA